MMQRERMARRALLAIRRDDRDLAERTRRRYEALEPEGEDAVVVRAEEAHQLVRPARWRQIARTTRTESSHARKWLGAPYVVGTPTLAMRKPARTASMRNSVSYS